MNISSSKSTIGLDVLFSLLALIIISQNQMKKLNITKKVIAVSAFVSLMFGIALVSSAQTYPSLSCSTSPSSPVGINTTVTLTATGGTGTYSWIGSGLSSPSTSSSQNSVSYGAPGSYMATVTSGNQSANCFVTVTGDASIGNNNNNLGTLTCSPSSQSTVVGRSISVSASGGNGNYVWSSPDLTITNPNGSGFSATYVSAGVKTLTVTSGGQVTSCTVVVSGPNPVPTTPTTPAPTLPNTGGGFGK